jgi:DNA polymerase I-like protein with 3'-5' exonuclease and polymerase domains
MVTILSSDNLDDFKHQLTNHDIIIIPIFSDAHLHPCNTSLCLLYFRTLVTDKRFILPIHHSEAQSIELPRELIESQHAKFVPDRKKIMHVLRLLNVIDTNVLQYMKTGKSAGLETPSTTAHFTISKNFPMVSGLNRIVPIVKHIEACEVLSSKMLELIVRYKDDVNSPSSTFLNVSATSVFQQIESNGIHVDEEVYKTHIRTDAHKHVVASTVHSEYNLFTTTGRPSNRFGGINFAALNKETGIRSAFTSRFGDEGGMVLFDYDAFHLRLVGNLIGFEFPSGNVHELFGKQYFDSKTLTPEQYEESKKITFQLLYGGIKEEYLNIPFFQLTQKFIDYLWDSFSTNGYIQSPIGMRKLYKHNMVDIHPLKLFNYFIQLHETEQNIMTLDKILPMFQDERSKVVLYTYDSVLIDFALLDGLDFLKQIKVELECENTYPTKVYVGNSYQEMKNITQQFRS